MSKALSAFRRANRDLDHAVRGCDRLRKKYGNEPRYASLPMIMKARGKPIDEVSLDELGVAYAPVQHIHALELPPGREAGVMVESVDELVDKLRNEAKVL